MAKSIKTVRKMIQYASEIKRKSFSIDNLTVGVKCALTDTTSGIAANPTVGNAIDRIIEHGGTAIFTETPEIIGAEHILAGRAVNSEVARQIVKTARRVEEHIKALGVDIRGANPSPGNIKAGITTIEEKSLGAILKAGLSKVMGVLKYGEKPRGRGLYLMDGPGRTHEALTGLISSSVTVIVMPTGGGSPSGSPIAPTIKVTGNPKTAINLEEYIDVDVSTVLKGEEGIEQAGRRVFDEIINVASGKKTKIESLGYGSIAIYTLWSHL